MKHQMQFRRGNFDELERFVGGDAEFRDGKIVVAGPEGPLWLSEGNWIIEEDGHYRVSAEPEGEGRE